MKTRTSNTVSVFRVLLLALIALAFIACGGGGGGGGDTDPSSPGGNDDKGSTPVVNVTGISVTALSNGTELAGGLEYASFSARVTGSNLAGSEYDVTWVVSPTDAATFNKDDGGTASKPLSSMVLKPSSDTAKAGQTITVKVYATAAPTVNPQTFTYKIADIRKPDLKTELDSWSFIAADGGAVPEAKTIWIYNQSGTNTDPLAGFSVALGGTDSAKFSVKYTNQSGTDISGGGLDQIPATLPVNGRIYLTIVPADTTLDGDVIKTYTARITISGTGITAKPIDLNYTIYPKTYRVKLYKDSGPPGNTTPLTSHDFGTIIENTTPLPVDRFPLTVTVANPYDIEEGNQATGKLDIKVLDEDGDPTAIFTVVTTPSPISTIITDGTASFIVTPAGAGLEGGIHTATIKVQPADDNLNKAKIAPVSFTVKVQVTPATWTVSLKDHDKAAAISSNPGATPPATYSLSNLKAGYTAAQAAAAAVKVDVTYTGNQAATGVYKVELDQGGNNYFTLGDTAIASPVLSKAGIASINQNATADAAFTITPFRGDGGSPAMSPDDVSARTATVTVTKTEAPDINTVLAKFTVSIMVLNKTAEEQYEDMIAAKVSSATDIGGSVYGVTLDAVTGMTNDRLTKLFNRLNDGRNYKVDLSACSGISNWTFSHGNMEFVNELILPPGVQTISSGFGGSLNASPLKISGTGVTIIRASAFVSSRIQEAAFTALQNIETLAFHGCGSLASLTVNKNRVTELAASVFSNNSVPAGTLNVIVGNETGVGVTGYTASTYWAAANVSGGTAPDKYGANHKAIKILAAP